MGVARHITEQLTGWSLPANVEVRIACGTPLCISPAHFDVVVRNPRVARIGKGAK
jgi:hypothetical protein